MKCPLLPPQKKTNICESNYSFNEIVTNNLYKTPIKPHHSFECYIEFNHKEPI